MSSPVTVAVLTTSQAVQRLIALVNAPSLQRAQPLLATLEAAMAAVARGDRVPAANQLGAFENKVKALFRAGLLTGAQEATLLSSADAIERGVG